LRSDNSLLVQAVAIFASTVGGGAGCGLRPLDLSGRARVHRAPDFFAATIRAERLLMLR
jgi:hypothetical protein